MNLRSRKGELLYDPEIEKTAKSNRKKTKERMADERPDMVPRQELERIIAERTVAERVRWIEEQRAEAALKEEQERAKSCLESITPQFKERRGVVYNQIGPN